MCRIVIRPNELKVSKGDDILTAMALGSSLGVCLYDEDTGIGGMVYTLLPEKKKGRRKETLDLRYVEPAIEALYLSMREAGAGSEHMWAKLVGGAKLFSFLEEGSEPDIGRENVEQAREKLQQMGIPIQAEDTGENYGRTVYFRLLDGSIDIETVNRLRYSI